MLKTSNKNLYNQLKESFQNVSLAKGVGYFQALAIDNLGNDEEIQNAVERNKAYGSNWEKFSEYLKENEPLVYPFSFMDEEGILFLIPVLITLEYKNELNLLLEEILSENNDHPTDFWNDVLTNNQRETLCNVYHYLANECLEYYKSYGITEKKALEELLKNENFGEENVCIGIFKINKLLKKQCR